MANSAKVIASMKMGGGVDSSKASTKTPKLDMAEELRAINAGKKGGYTQAQKDSVAKTFNRKAWLKTVDETGYEVKNKKQP